MRDTPGDMTTTISCPACGSGHIETLHGAGADGGPEYHCHDCGTEFDAGGGEPPLTDSADPDAP